MKERPILFSAPMVSALLAGTKTQTRRICKPAQFYSLSQVVEVPDPQEHGQVDNGSHFGDEEGDVQFASPYGGRGDRLWVRETWGYIDPDNSGDDFDTDAGPGAHFSSELCTEGHPVRNFWRRRIAYRADWKNPRYGIGPDAPKRWRPSIHMPRWASRITLEVTGVRVERLQDISEADCIAEGIESLTYRGMTTYRNYALTDEWAAVSPMLESPIASYRSLWESINGPGSRDANPLVWVVSFKQWGAWSPGYAEHGNCLSYEDMVRAKQHEWPEGHCSFRVGKKAAGRLLDGREWNEVPA